MTEAPRTYATAFCEDIRQEGNGKHILIGVYGGGLVPGALPQTVNLAVWTKIYPAPLGSHTFSLTLVSDGAEIGLQGNSNFSGIDDGEAAVIAAGPFPVALRGPGVVRAYISFDGGPRELSGQLVIKPVPIPAPIH